MHTDAWKQTLPLVLIFLVIIVSPLVYDLVQLVGSAIGWK